MQRRELDEPAQLVLDGGVDQHRIAERRATVDDAVRDSVDARRQRGERLDSPRLVRGVDNRELQARRARVDDEDAVQPGQVQSRTSGWSSPS